MPFLVCSKQGGDVDKIDNTPSIICDVPLRDVSCCLMTLNLEHTGSSTNDIPYNKTRAALQARGFGSPMGRHSGCTRVSKSFGSGLLLLLTSTALSTSAQAGWGNNTISSTNAW